MDNLEKSTKQQVLDAITILCQENKLATRENIAQVTNLKLSIIDDRIKVLIDDGLIVRIQRGAFVLVNQFKTPRVISKTVLQDGITVLDIGDTVIHLTPIEARVLGQLLVGDAFFYTLLGISNQLERIQKAP